MKASNTVMRKSKRWRKTSLVKTLSTVYKPARRVQLSTHPNFWSRALVFTLRLSCFCYGSFLFHIICISSTATSNFEHSKMSQDKQRDVGRSSGNTNKDPNYDATLENIMQKNVGRIAELEAALATARQSEINYNKGCYNNIKTFEG
ncbi:hypothetical protein DFS34DRAFT_591414 [Phlyctochytrium arcticum]|nr:hypothetical protein DFS34DRAFT_591414 [Phlyctochytrium arcticum]